MVTVSGQKLIRLFFGIVRDTSEEQLTEFFKNKGLVVAIGKPGRKLFTLGASYYVCYK